LKNHFYATLTKLQAEENLDLTFTVETWNEFSAWVMLLVSNNNQSELPNVISSALEEFESSDSDDESTSSQEFWARVPELESTPWFKVTENEIRVLHTRDEIESIASQVLSDAEWEEIVDKILGMYEEYTFSDDLQQFLEI
jgi:hypothetical protein